MYGVNGSELGMSNRIRGHTRLSAPMALLIISLYASSKVAKWTLGQTRTPIVVDPGVAWLYIQPHLSVVLKIPRPLFS